MVNLKTRDKDVYEVHVNWGNTTELKCSKEALFTSRGEVMALDFNRDMIIDLYGLDSEGMRTFWIFNSSRLPPDHFHQAEPTEVKGNSLSIPNANAYVDIDGDFLADLFLQTENSYEVWHGTSVPKLALHEEEDATGAKTELFLHFLPDSNLA